MYTRSILFACALATAASAHWCRTTFLYGYLKIPHNDGSGQESYLTLQNSPGSPDTLITVSDAQSAQRFYTCMADEGEWDDSYKKIYMDSPPGGDGLSYAIGVQNVTPNDYNDPIMVLTPFRVLPGLYDQATFDGASDTNNQIDIFDATRGGLLSHLTAGTRYSVDTTTRFVPNGHSYPYVGDDGLILSSAEYASDIWMNNAPVSFVFEGLATGVGGFPSARRR